MKGLNVFQRCRKGFTIIELMTVVMVLGVVTTLVVSNYTKVVTEVQFQAILSLFHKAEAEAEIALMEGVRGHAPFKLNYLEESGNFIIRSVTSVHHGPELALGQLEMFQFEICYKPIGAIILTKRYREDGSEGWYVPKDISQAAKFAKLLEREKETVTYY